MSEPLFSLFPTLDIQHTAGVQSASLSARCTSLACQVPLGHYGKAGAPFTNIYTVFSGEGTIREECAHPNLASMTLWVDKCPQDKERAMMFAALSISILILNKNHPPSAQHPIYLRGIKEEEIRLFQSVLQWLVPDPSAVLICLTGFSNRFFPKSIGNGGTLDEVNPVLSQVKALLMPPTTASASVRLG
ncbi:MAG: hypothetical protein NTW08_03660 [Gammaproteobacteria bacterium]|nr:hypothetical protein [Gammaproteobacteria bacterium]